MKSARCLYVKNYRRTIKVLQDNLRPISIWTSQEVYVGIKLKVYGSVITSQM